MHEFKVMPAVVVIDTSETAEMAMDETGLSLLAKLCADEIISFNHTSSLLTVITSGGEPQIIKCWHTPMRKEQVRIICKGENNMHRALFMAMEELRYVCRHLEKYEIPYVKPRIYLLDASEADDEDSGVTKALRLRVNRGICEFIAVICRETEEKPVHLPADIINRMIISDTYAGSIEWIRADLKAGGRKKI